MVLYSYVKDTNSWTDYLGLEGEKVKLFHFTDKDGYKAINAQKDVTIKASKPTYNVGKPKGAFFTTDSPEKVLKNPKNMV